MMCHVDERHQFKSVHVIFVDDYRLVGICDSMRNLIMHVSYIKPYFKCSAYSSLFLDVASLLVFLFLFCFL